jgi:predicted Zn-dependent protease
MTDKSLNHLIGQRAARVTLTDLSVQNRLTDSGYWPARAAKLFEAKAYSEVIALCREQLDEEGQAWSGRIIYAQALYHSGQLESAEQQLQQVLSWDPDHLVALKYLGDIRFAQNDQFGAFSLYQRVLQIDPDCRGLKSDLETRPETTTRTITVKRPPESVVVEGEKLPEAPFYTETIGDLYLSQGHARMAAQVFRRLLQQESNPRWQEKLEQAERRQSNSRSSN